VITPGTPLHKKAAG
jgi:hypothetical protein